MIVIITALWFEVARLLSEKSKNQSETWNCTTNKQMQIVFSKCKT